MITLLFAFTAFTAPGVADPPRLSAFSLDNGAFNSADRVVGLSFRADGSAPTLFRVSEKPDLAGAGWRAMTSTPTYTLSSTPGVKIVYFQLGAPLPALPLGGKTAPTGTVGSVILIPGLVSNIVSDTIVLGLPDLRMEVSMPKAVQDGNGRTFLLDVTVRNAGQGSPPGQVITLYNSFVENKLAMEAYDVTFGLGRLVGRGCVITDVPTIECDLAPIPPGGAVGFHFTASVNNLLTAGQFSATYKLRSRIFGIAESNIANNWVDTPVTVVR